MKKLILLLALVCLMASASFAQHEVVKKQTKVKRTSTMKQKVHNVFHKKKHYNGYKVTHTKTVKRVQ